METTLMSQALGRANLKRPPVWLMRQAGRYHGHYQELRKKHSFVELCTRPEVACEATLGPIRDFDFDAAILFSDLLFPLDALGMGLSYPDGPALEWQLGCVSDLQKLSTDTDLIKKLSFQGEALKLIRSALPAQKALLGFVGGPWTLFCYAVEGRHQGSLISAKTGLYDGRFAGFFKVLGPLLVQNMVLQARSGADAVCVLDTCAGELDPMTYRDQVVPYLKEVLEQFKKECPSTPIVYYGKTTGPEHWHCLKELPIEGLGVDWRHDIGGVLSEWGSRWAIQGNLDPVWLFLSPEDLENKLRAYFASVKALPKQARAGWICGLGHGVLPKTPESSVRLFMKLQQEYFGDDQ